jgi:hypothetical protein
MAPETGRTRQALEASLRRGSFLVLKFTVACAFLLGFPAAHSLFAQGSEAPAEKGPTLSADPLTQDQLAVYRVVLSNWMDNGKGTHIIHLAIQTMPFLLSDMDSECGKNLHMNQGSVNEVHKFRSEDIPQLSPSKVKLVDPEAQSKEVVENDPHTNIRKGTSIESAVENGFAHGLTTLGEIHFDKDHTHAIVAYDFSCGRTCGNGSTVILEKKNGEWHLISRCSVSVA